MGTNNNSKSTIYTYRKGKKVYLKKEQDLIVVRGTPKTMERMGFHGNLQQVSSNSTRLGVEIEELDSTLDEIRKEAVAHHAYTQESTGAEFLITDRIMITFKEDPTNEVLSAFMAKYALILITKYSDREFLLRLTDQTGMNPLKLVVLINETEQSLIESCEHDLNQRMVISNINIPVDPKYLKQWHLHNRFTDVAFDPRSSSNCEDAWKLLNHYGDSDVVIAVTDDGCKLDHADFDSENKFAQWAYMEANKLIDRNSISANSQNMYQTGSDHGTCCCGVVAAEVDGTLTVGAAPDCRLLPIKWESSGRSLFIGDSGMMSMLTFVADKVDVVSNSWGRSPVSNYASNVINKITQLAQTGGRRGKGIVFLWAAGNENCPIKYTGNLDIPYTNGYHGFRWVGVKTSRNFEHNLIGVPGVMYIAALASNAQRSHYSNYGEGISLSAPSSNSHSYWRKAVTGLGILTSSGAAPFFDTDFGGTSSATPLVAGIAGLVISANPELTALEVISILQRTASKDLNMTPYSRTPAANFDPDTSWDISPINPFNTGDFKSNGRTDGSWSGWFGFGKVDAYSAVAEALRTKSPDSDNDTIIQSSFPAIAIPDNNPTGITDTITINDSGTVQKVTIDLDITHSYIGDLIIRLISPRGTPAILQERNGGSTKNILKTFDLQNAPTLSRFKGEPASGRWTLEVIDAAAMDIGKLNKWTIQIGVGTNSEIEMEESPGIPIPDNNPVGIERNLNVLEDGIIKEIKIGIDITHTYIADLIVNMVSPEGSVISLHSRIGGSADNIIKDYDFTNLPDLRNLQGQSVQGIWRLRISDVAGQDVGKLNKWSIKIVMV